MSNFALVIELSIISAVPTEPFAIWFCPMASFLILSAVTALFAICVEPIPPAVLNNVFTSSFVYTSAELAFCATAESKALMAPTTDVSLPAISPVNLETNEFGTSVFAGLLETSNPSVPEILVSFCAIKAAISSVMASTVAI